jgi:hypothetical protein
MDIYILDALLRRETLVDKYISLIWTERFAAYGDFEIHLESTQSNRTLFAKNALLACNTSNYIMQVKTVEDTADDDGNRVFIVKGLSFEIILENRAAFGILDDLTTVPKWTITAPPATVARQIFHDICVTGILDEGDKIPYIVEGSFLPEDTIPEPVDPILAEITPQSVYSAIKSICDTWSLGFRLLRFGDASQIYFDIYSGSDRTTKQDILDAVVFTPELDNLQNTSELSSVDDYKNVAYVFSPAGVQVVYPPNVDPEIEGFDRHVLTVEADDITSDNPDVAAALKQRGLDELSKHRSFAAFDGEINPNSSYKYGVHYYLGDVVEVRNVDGVTNDMRVTEQIFVCDSEGERAYPTLSVNLFIDTGSWLSWKANQVWADLGPTEYWENA